MALIIRHATGDDMPKLVELGQQFAEASPYYEYYDEDQFISIVYRLLSMETAACFVAEKDSELIGFIYGMLSHLWFNQGVPVVGELAWWVTPDQRGRAGILLLKELEQWARERKAVILSMSELANDGTSLGELMWRRGFRPAEINHIKKFEHGST